jgi:hypothetical protein
MASESGCVRPGRYGILYRVTPAVGTKHWPVTSSVHPVSEPEHLRSPREHRLPVQSTGTRSRSAPPLRLVRRWGPSVRSDGSPPALLHRRGDRPKWAYRVRGELAPCHVDERPGSRTRVVGADFPQGGRGVAAASEVAASGTADVVQPFRFGRRGTCQLPRTESGVLRGRPPRQMLRALR